MSFDNLCKYLSEQYPASFAAWLLGTPPTAVSVLKTELGSEPIRADSVTFLQTQERLLHLEFQARVDSNPSIALRMLDYWMRLHRRYQLPITQVVVLLRSPSAGTVIPSHFEFERTRHEYDVIKLWEQDPQPFLQDPALLPLAALAAAPQPETLLSQVSQQISQISSPQQRQEIATCAQVLAGLRFSQALIQQFFREEMMQESVIYQSILQRGLQQGIQQGEQQAEQRLILRLLSRRVGQMSAEVQSQVLALPSAQLEALGEALLDFSTPEDLLTWLEAHSGS